MSENDQRIIDNSTEVLNADSVTRLLDADALVTRIAQNLRTQGDPDLPLSFYIEQVKQQLLKGDTLNSSQPAANRSCNDDLYKSWAIGRG